jgi:hypothetical protein
MSDKFPKLYELKEITVQSVSSAKWTNWTTGKPEVSLTPRSVADGFKKSYTMKFDKGELDISPANLGSMLEACYGVKEQGKAILSGAIFEVISKKILNPDGTPKLFKDKYPTYNYYFNFKGYVTEVFQVEEDFENTVDESQIPF